MADLVITDEQRKCLLHAYETIMFRIHLLPREAMIAELELLRTSWLTIFAILSPNENIREAIHQNSEWEGDNLLWEGHWKALL